MAPKNKFRELAEKMKLRVAGLMSGTSADGVDAAIVDIERQKVRLLAFHTVRYSPALRAKVLELCRPQSARLDDICHYNFVLGEVFAEALIDLCRKSRMALSSIDLIGSHGQTIYHSPRPRRRGKNIIRSTLQIAEPSVIAERTGITTVADFRPRDMAAGGQGAPLVPYADYILFRNSRRRRAIQNIGGIANVTFLPAACRHADIIAFDTGPGNMVIDRVVSLVTAGSQQYDRKGRLAAQGTVDTTLLKRLLRHPYFKRQPPKTTGREEFGFQYADRLAILASQRGLKPPDTVATATALTAVTIAQAYRSFLPKMPDEIILCGGGAHNLTLLGMLQQQLEGVKILPMDDFEISIDAKEAVSFAILAYATIKGLPGNVPGATGAGRSVVLGKIVPA